jgi:DNA-binding transcriptional MerR regulator
MALLTRGELAKHSAVHPETIRYYEKHGLLPAPSRSVAGYRQFEPLMIGHVRFIKRAQGVGFSLEEIRQLLGLRRDQDSSCGDVRTLAQAKIAEIDQRIADLQAMRSALSSLTEACPGGVETVDHCPILSSFEDQI